MGPNHAFLCTAGHSYLGPPALLNAVLRPSAVEPFYKRRSARIIERPSLAFVRRLDRPLALDRNSVHDPALALVVGYRVVLDTAVVPERDRIRPPSVATGEFRPYCMLIEPAQQRRALLLGHVLEADREVAVDIKALASGLDMSTHDRVLDFAVRLIGVSDRHRRAQPGEE